MSQKNYNMRIVGALLKKEGHVRGLARELNTSQTTVARKMQELCKDNVADYRIEGKNKVFFLKKTLEAKQSACIAEMQNQIDAVKKYPHLRIVFEQIKQNEKVHLAVLFGSYAKGSAGKDSDIDVYIETTDRDLKKMVDGIDSRISAKIGKYDRQNLLIREIEKNHVVIKGVEEYYEKSRFFE